jgi:uroporphyrinogen decarboxylase
VTHHLADGAFLATMHGRVPEHRPVWFMRQAGRSLPEYLAIREGVGMLDSCRRPELVVEITTQPVRRYGVDAAVLFSDIVVPLAAAGVELDIVAGTGPVIASPVRDAAAVAALPELDPSDVDFVAEACAQLAATLEVPLLGFAGAPFTLASYLVEGGPSREHLRTKELMHAHTDTWHALCDHLARLTGTFLRVQVDNGAAAVQLFDSWAGTLTEADYRRYVLPHSRTALAAVPEVPRVHFGVGTGELLSAMAEAGCEAVGIDWRVPLDVAATRVPAGTVLQGNLDPALVATAPWPLVEQATREVMAAGDRAVMAGAGGHVFNLGHGVLPQTDPDVLARVVDLVHATALP